PPAWYKCFNGDFIYAIHATDSAPAGYLNRHTAAYRKHTQGIWSSKSETYITVNFAKTCQALLTSYRDRYEEILLGHISACYQKLLDSDLSQQLSCQRDSDTTKPQSEPDLVSVQDFTVDGYWTPQTKMLQVIKAWLETLSLPVSCALSIDVNPDLDRMLTGRWPDILITRAVFPEYDVQNMYQIPDNSFDVVYSHQVLEHVPRPWLAGAEMVRALKPGGIGIHTSCAFNPRHGQPDFNDYYRFLPDGLEQLFDGVTVLEKGEWGNRQAILYNVAIDDGYGSLGGRRFHESIGHYSDGLYPWHTWIIFQKLP
ncbi:MAG TPA: class I SAM-dependent methyltransferase, partial [Deltaproteobacteria bacterium]|nr:class I SAM-dependent methyltransferase [Deltaproteobacteria bacterium]